MQVKKQQLEPDLEQWTDSKSGKEYVKAVYCHPAYLTYTEHIMRNAGLEEAQAGIKTDGRNINNLIYASLTLTHTYFQIWCSCVPKHFSVRSLRTSSFCYITTVKFSVRKFCINLMLLSNPKSLFNVLPLFP